MEIKRVSGGSSLFDLLDSEVLNKYLPDQVDESKVMKTAEGYDELNNALSVVIEEKVLPKWKDQLKKYFPGADVTEWFSAIKTSMRRDPINVYSDISECFLILEWIENGGIEEVKTYLAEACSSQTLQQALTNYGILCYSKYAVDITPIIEQGLLKNPNNNVEHISAYFKEFGKNSNKAQQKGETES